MPRLVDTTIRLLSQEPLAGHIPTAELLQVAELLDRAGFEYLEVSGGGVFDNAVRRGVESPWERIRALKARTSTPLALALRGRFLVGARPASDDVVRRFIASAAANGIDVFRLHDPLNDVSNLREAGEAIAAAGGEFAAGLVYGSGYAGETESLLAQARQLREIGAARILLHDPSGALAPGQAGILVAALREAAELPVGLYCQGSGGNALATALEGARAGADRIGCAVYPVALCLHRVSGEGLAEALAGLELGTGVDEELLWRASELVDEHIGDQPVPPLTPRIAVRAAERRVPVGLVAAVQAQLRTQGAGDRLDDLLDELLRVREEVGWPPLAPPIGQALASQALVHVLSASRYAVVVDEVRLLLRGDYGMPPGPIDATVRRAVELLSEDGAPVEPVPDLDEVRARATGLAASEEELVLLALFGDEAEGLLRAIRGRSRGDETLEGSGVERPRAEQIRELVRIVQESGVAELTVEEGGVRVSVRRDSVPSLAAPVAVPEPALLAAAEPSLELAPVEPPRDGMIRIESPMVGTFYRAAEPGAAPFVELGDTVVPGQTVCILEAMKLMNEVKADAAGVVRTIHVDNAAPVEYGQLLFELEPVLGPPLDAI